MDKARAPVSALHVMTYMPDRQTDRQTEYFYYSDLPCISHNVIQ